MARFREDNLRAGFVFDDDLGAAIAARLLAAGVQLSVFEPIPSSRIKELERLGAANASSMRDAAHGAGFVFANLLSVSRLEEVLFGINGVTEALQAGAVVVDLSTTPPPATLEFSQRASSVGIHWVDSPSSGSVAQATSGDLTFVQGGTPEDVMRVQSVLAAASSSQTRMGDIGAGQTTKLINQLLCGAGFLAVAEATAIALHSGVNALKIPAALAGGRADSAILQEYLPLFCNSNYATQNTVAHMVDDLSAVGALASATGTPTPLFATALELYKQHARQGFGGHDLASLIEIYDPRNN